MFCRGEGEQYLRRSQGQRPRGAFARRNAKLNAESPRRMGEGGSKSLQVSGAATAAVPCADFFSACGGLNCSCAIKEINRGGKLRSIKGPGPAWPCFGCAVHE